MMLVDRPNRIARAFGWFSIGLGVAELLAPRALARATGLRGREGALKAFGAREIATGVGLLAARNPAPWLWGRVAGDVLDALTLGSRLPSRQRASGSPGVALAIVAAVAAADLVLACNAREKRLRELRGREHDYSDRSGFAHSPDAMRGVAREGLAAAPA
jgi:hypothetical protein